MKAIDFIEVAICSTLVILASVGAFKMHEKRNVTWANAQRYAIEHKCECYGSRDSLVFVFSNGDLIGSEVMYHYGE